MGAYGRGEEEEAVECVGGGLCGHGMGGDGGRGEVGGFVGGGGGRGGGLRCLPFYV